MSNVYPFVQGYRKPGPPAAPRGGDVVVHLEVDGNTALATDHVTQIPLADGSLQIIFGEPDPEQRETENFEDNLAEHLTEAELGIVAERLLRGIEIDEQSRDAWLQNISNGISLLGLEIKQPRGAAGTGAAPTEGVSTVDHPLLLEAVLRFQANARGELLPTDGPVKVRNDGEADAWTQRLAQALEKDLNHYLTRVASEYVPDTDRMLLMLGFTGIAFKKGNHDPVRRRPVIESIDAKDLIVSNAATNLEGAGRVTHRIRMRPPTMRRMQLLGAYRDIQLPLAGLPFSQNAIEQKIDKVQGIAPAAYIEPEDAERELYECYCEIEIPGFEHEIDGEQSGLPLPYKVTIDKESRRILEIRRNWNDEDPLCLPRNRIIAYIFVPGMGFYGIGLLNILGNSTKAVTAAWRLMIDAGMFANFPGFLYLKSMAKQLTNQFRVAPGTGMPIDASGNDIGKAILPLPYKEASAVFIQLIDNIAQQAQRVGGTAELQVGEGKQDAPVGTTLALIEQATRIMNAVHKRLHNSQSLEFIMLKELLSEDPSALWRHNKKSKVLRLMTERLGQEPVAVALEQAEERHNAMFVAALNDLDLIPRADPNTSSQTERYLKIVALKQIQAQNPRIDRDEVDLRAMQTLGIDDAESLFLPPPEPGSVPPDPQTVMAMAKMAEATAKTTDANTKAQEAAFKSQLLPQQMAAKREEMAIRERIAQDQIERERIIHSDNQRTTRTKLAFDAHQQALDRLHAYQMHNEKLRHAASEAGLGRAHEHIQGGLGRYHEHMLGEAGRQHERLTGEQTLAEGGVARAHETYQGGLDRAHEHVQKEADREHKERVHLASLAHEAEENAKQRAHERSMPKPKPGEKK